MTSRKRKREAEGFDEIEEAKGKVPRLCAPHEGIQSLSSSEYSSLSENSSTIRREGIFDKSLEACLRLSYPILAPLSSVSALKP